MEINLEKMNYEQRYKEALERAEILIEKLESNHIKGFIYHIFPELKESEDERNIKDLIDELKCSLRAANCQNYACRGGHEKRIALLEWGITWLEKQGDTNETINRDKLAQDVLRGAAINLITWIDYNAAEGNMCLSNMECKDIEDALVSGDWDKIYAYIKKKLEKQGEKPQGKTALEVIKEEKIDNQNCVKNIDKVEPKFHEGDWIVQENIGVYKVIEVCESWYEVVDNKDKHYSISFDKEYMCHLWSIYDAKDGDVLCYENKDDFIIFIYKCGHIHYHCCYCNGHLTTVDSFFVVPKYLLGYIHPATKEQRELLFQKIKEADYVFDSEKKS